MKSKQSASKVMNEKSRLDPNPAEKAARAAGLKLMNKSKICMLGTQGADGFVNIRAVLNLKHRGLKQIWFSTNTSSQKVSQIQKDNRVCVYYTNENSFEGLMLTGTIQILQDPKSRKMLWSEGAEVYYPLGVNDPDYSVLGFSAQKANYYHGLNNIWFNI
jgi:general stress protein 26